MTKILLWFAVLFLGAGRYALTPHQSLDCVEKIKYGMSLGKANAILEDHGFRMIAGDVGGGEIQYTYKNAHEKRKILIAVPFRGSTGINLKELQKSDDPVKQVLRWLASGSGDFDFKPDQRAQCFERIKTGMTVRDAEAILKEHKFVLAGTERNGDEVYRVHLHQDDGRAIVLVTPREGDKIADKMMLGNRNSPIQRLLHSLDID